MSQHLTEQTQWQHCMPALICMRLYFEKCQMNVLFTLDRTFVSCYEHRETLYWGPIYMLIYENEIWHNLFDFVLYRIRARNLFVISACRFSRPRWRILVGFNTSAVQAATYQNGDYMGSLNKTASGAQCFIMAVGLFWDIVTGLPWTPNGVGSLEPRGYCILPPSTSWYWTQISNFLTFWSLRLVL